MFQDHQTISALSCFFDAAKVLRKTRQNNAFPTTSPKNPQFWEKSGISWEKQMAYSLSREKSMKNRKILTKSNKTPLFCCKLFPTLSPKNKGVWEKSGLSWEKSRHYWEKSHVSWENGNLVKNIVHAPHALKGQKLLAQGTRPG